MSQRRRAIYVAHRTGLFAGLIAIGAALGLSVSLQVLQTQAQAAGAWPSIYDTAAPSTYPLYTGAKTLQSMANGSGVGGAVLVLVAGVIDRYGPEPEAADE